MKKVMALLGFVLAAGSISQAQEQGKISFFECKLSGIQKMSLFAGADTEALLNKIINKGQCKLVTDLSFENAARALRDPNILNEGLASVDNLPYGYDRNYCDGEDKACMDVEEVNRPGEANLTTLFLSPSQIQTISQIADDGLAKKHAKKSIYFIADESKKSETHGNGYDGKWSYFELKKSALLIK